MSIKILNFNQIFSENAHILSTRTGFSLVNGEYKPNENDILIVFGCHTQDIINKILLLLQNNKTIKIVIMQTEQIGSKLLDNKYYIKLLKLARVFVFDWSYENVMKLHKYFDINVRSVFSFDYYKRFDDIDDKWEDRPIDICFIGSRNDARERNIRTLQYRYPTQKFFVDFDYSLTDSNKLTKVLKKCKFVLNMPFYENSALETHRINKALACGCKVLSYHSSDNQLDDIYENYVYFGRFTKWLDLYYGEKCLPDRKDWAHYVENILSKTMSNNIEVFKKILDVEIDYSENSRKLN